MSDFIQRRFQNIDTNEIIEFDVTTSAHEYLPLNKSNIENFNHLTFTVVLGEGGSGKTSLLKEYNKMYEKSLYVDYLNMRNDYDIKEDTDTVLLDAIDEEFARNSNDRQSEINLITFIKRCQRINHKVKFIFSIRSAVWPHNRKFFEGLADGVLSVYELDNKSTISIILGEPASGKTYQLKKYAESNHHSHFISLIALKETDTIPEDIEVVLIDSIDEALMQNNQKTLARELTEYMQRCQEANPKVRFVISSRFLEWSEYFESSLKEVDKELHVYSILDLSKEDINKLLMQKNIDMNDFWVFIESNYLEPLLKNILVILTIINRFETYKNEAVTYIGIYHDLTKEYLTKKGDDREEIAVDIPTEKLLDAASSLATHMTFNRVNLIDSSNLSMLASELYKINGEDIEVAELQTLLNTALFEKTGTQFNFFHQSIQEYLTAYFLANKKLDSQTLQGLLASKMRFYEEFEEVVVYLTNIQPELFDDFVNFDPFIFKRHPSLDEEKQEKLLLSILEKYKNDRTQAWGRWESFDDSTLVRFDKLSNLIPLLKKNITDESTDYFLMKLLEYSYSSELQAFIFEIFNRRLIKDRSKLKKLLKYNFVNNYAFNVELYQYLRVKSLLEKDDHIVPLSFEGDLFCSLYGIQFKEEYGFDRILKRTEYDFDELVPLFDCIPVRMLKYIAPYLQIEDSKKWFEYVKESYDENKYHGKYIAWVLYALLKDYDSQDMLVEILHFLNDKHIRVYNLDDIQELGLDFNIVADDFWTLYFESNLFDNFYAKGILELFTITIEDIKRASSKHHIKNYPEKYIKFRLDEEINGFLMEDAVFKEHMEEIWEKHEEQQRKHDEELKEMIEGSEGYEESKKIETQWRQTYEQSISNLSSRKELYDIFDYLINEEHDLVSDLLKLDQVLKEESGSKYIELLELIKKEWNEDNTYLDIKLNLAGNSIPILPTAIFLYLFFVSSKEEIEEYINNEEAYTKLYWHLHRAHHEIREEYFLYYTERYFDLFVSLTIEALSLTFEQNDGRDIGYFATMIRLASAVKKFNQQDLDPLIKYLQSIDRKIYKQLAGHERRYLLRIVALDKENYQFIHNLMIEDIDNCSDYLQILLNVDTNRALDDFFQIYSKVKRYSVKAFLQRYFSRKNQDSKKGSKYDNIKVNPQKRDLYFSLMRAIEGSKISYDNIQPSYLKRILTDYYTFFTEYETPTRTYSPDIYDKMYWVTNNMWIFLESSTPNIQMLEELKKSKNIKLSESAKYRLTKAYEQQAKDRNYSNSYYKEIFNETEENTDEYSEQNRIGLKAEEWYQKWWIISLGVGILVGGFISFQFTWMLGFGAFFVSFLIMLILNPKRRYWIAAWIVFSWTGINAFLNFVGTMNIPKNSYINGIIKFGQNSSIIVTLALIGLTGFLFWLDHKERK